MLSQRIHGAFMAQQFLWLTYPVGASSAQKRAQSRAGFLLPNEQEVYNLGVCPDCWQLDWQISSAAQISNALSQNSQRWSILPLNTRYIVGRSSEVTQGGRPHRVAQTSPVV